MSRRHGLFIRDLWLHTPSWNFSGGPLRCLLECWAFSSALTMSPILPHLIDVIVEQQLKFIALPLPWPGLVSLGTHANTVLCQPIHAIRACRNCSLVRTVRTVLSSGGRDFHARDHVLKPLFRPAIVTCSYFMRVLSNR